MPVAELPQICYTPGIYILALIAAMVTWLMYMVMTAFVKTWTKPDQTRPDWDSFTCASLKRLLVDLDSKKRCLFVENHTYGVCRSSEYIYIYIYKLVFNLVWQDHSKQVAYR